MPERKIIDTPNGCHFVTFSTYQRRRFLDPERTRSIVVEVLQSCLQNHGASCQAFVVMPDHVHAIITTATDASISTFMLAWKKTSSYRIKQFYRQELENYHSLCPEGCPIWQAKFYDFNLESEKKYLEKIEYIHNNPAVAGIAPTFVEWKWSSARFYELREEVGVTITFSS
jgi:putative transposase